LLDSPVAPTARIEPSLDSATLLPNASYSSVLDALIYASWRQLLPLRRNTYAAPAAGALLLVSSPSIVLALPSSGSR
jgi:hypothetical protein